MGSKAGRPRVCDMLKNGVNYKGCLAHVPKSGWMIRSTVAVPYHVHPHGIRIGPL